MRFFRKVNAALLLAFVVLASVASNYSFAQSAEARHDLFLTVSGSVSSGHISSKPEGTMAGTNYEQTLGSINIGAFTCWKHMSADIQFTTSPFVSSLSNQGSSLKAIGMQFWFGYSVFDNAVLRISPTIGFGLYRFQGTSGDNIANAHVNLTMSGEVFIPESRVLLGLRAGYQHNFLLPTAVDATSSANAGGAVVQLRTGFRIF